MAEIIKPLLHTKIESIDDEHMAHLLNDIALVCELNLMDYSSSTLFSFLELCYGRHDLKKKARLYPWPDGILDTRVSNISGAVLLTKFLREYCALRGVLFEGYETRKLHRLISDLAPKKVLNPRKVSPLNLLERSNNLVKLRRANGDR